MVTLPWSGIPEEECCSRSVWLALNLFTPASLAAILDMARSDSSMNYPLLLQKLFWRIFAKLDRPPEQIAQHETLTRFIFSARHFDSKKNVIDSAAFLPPKDGKQSIYRTDGCSDTKIWWLGDCYVTRKRKDRKK